MYCTNCGKQISDSAMVCPFCFATLDGPPTGKKAPGWEGQLEDNASGLDFDNIVSGNNNNDDGGKEKKKKNITLIVSLVVSLLIIVAGVVCYFLFLHERVMEYLENRNETSQTDDEDSDDKDKDEDKDKDNRPVEESAVFDDFEYDDTTVIVNSETADFYINLGSTLNQCTFEMTEDSVTALNSYDDYYFSGIYNTKSYLDSISSYCTYPELSKSVSKYDSTMIKFENVYIREIEETEYGEYTYFCMIDDSGNYLIGVLRGTVGMYADDYIEFYGIPLDKVSFTTYEGRQEQGIFFAMAYCEKTEAPDVPFDAVDQLMNDPKSYFIQQEQNLYGYSSLPLTYKVVTKTGSGLNMRAWCDVNAEKVTLLDFESLVWWYGSYNGWSYVETLDGLYSGWVSSEFIVPEN